MTTPPRTIRPFRRLGRPAAVLAAGLLVCAAMAAMPGRWLDPLRSAAAEGLRPAQRAANDLQQRCSRLIHHIRWRWRPSQAMLDLRRHCSRLEEENRRLGEALRAAEGRQPGTPVASAGPAVPPLLQTRCITARVLGRQALDCLGQRSLLDVGRKAGVESDALVVASGGPAVIDCGRDARLEAGQIVLSGRHVCGRIDRATPSTSAVRTVRAAGYRDLVRVVAERASPGGAAAGVQGILEGTGEPLVRIRRVDVSAPVSVGDLVVTDALKGLLPEPLLYGRVVRAERPAGSAHWELWMEPAAPAELPHEVAVLRAEFNPQRTASLAPLDSGARR